MCGEGGTESMEEVHGVGHLSEVLVFSVVSGSTRWSVRVGNQSSGSWCGLCLSSEFLSEFTCFFWCTQLTPSDWCDLCLSSGDPYVWAPGDVSRGRWWCREPCQQFRSFGSELRALGQVGLLSSLLTSMACLFYFFKLSLLMGCLDDHFF